MSDVVKLPKSKFYTDIRELMKDLAVDEQFANVSSGVIVLFDHEGSIQVMPCCTKQQCAFAAADLLKKAAE